MREATRRKATNSLCLLLVAVSAGSLILASKWAWIAPVESEGWTIGSDDKKNIVATYADDRFEVLAYQFMDAMGPFQGGIVVENRTKSDIQLSSAFLKDEQGYVAETEPSGPWAMSLPKRVPPQSKVSGNLVFPKLWFAMRPGNARYELHLELLLPNEKLILKPLVLQCGIWDSKKGLDTSKGCVSKK